MVRRRRTPAEIINEFPEAEVAVTTGPSFAPVDRVFGNTEQTYGRRCNEGGGLQVEQARTLSQLE